MASVIATVLRLIPFTRDTAALQIGTTKEFSFPLFALSAFFAVKNLGNKF